LSYQLNFRQKMMKGKRVNPPIWVLFSNSYLLESQCAPLVRKRQLFFFQSDLFVCLLGKSFMLVAQGVLYHYFFVINQNNSLSFGTCMLGFVF